MLDILLYLFNGDLDTKNGDFDLGESTIQNKTLLMFSQKYEWRQHPYVGIGAQNYLNDDSLSELELEIKKQFEMDGLKVNRIDVFEDGSISEDSSY